MLMSQLILGFVMVSLVVLVCILTYYVIKQAQQIEYMTQSGYINKHSINTPNYRNITDLDDTINNDPVGMRSYTLRMEIPEIPEPQEPQEPHELLEVRGEEYFDHVQFNNHNDNNQNVHDHQIVIDLKRKYKRLLELNDYTVIKLPSHLIGVASLEEYIQSFIDSMFQELSSYIQLRFETEQANQLNHSAVQKLQRVIETARNAAEFYGFSVEPEYVGIREDWILAQVWYRIQSNDNKLVKDSLLISLIDQLLDAAKLIEDPVPRIIQTINALVGANVIRPQIPVVEIGTECTHGRIARYINTFICVDTDEILSKQIKDTKEYENEAYTKSAHLLHKSLYDNPDMDLIYTRIDADLNPAETVLLEAFKENVRTIISDELTLDYKDLVPAESLTNIITKCKAGI